MPLTPLPTPPSRSDSANFATRADAFLSALATFSTELSAMAPTIEAGAAAAPAAQASASSAAGFAAAAQASAELAAGVSAGSAGTYPPARPTLLLDFANARSVDPRITFSRSSTATRVNARGRIETVAANVPRIQFDAGTGECQGLLLEPASTNLALWSEDETNAAWTRTGLAAFGAGSVANNATAPDGANTAEYDAEAVGAGASYAGQSFTTVAGTVYTISRYFRAGSRTIAQLWVSTALLSTGEGFANFNLSLGTVTRVGTGATARMFNAGGGWWRCTLTFTADRAATGQAGYALQTNPTGGRLEAYTGDGSSGFFGWGLQFEQLEWASSYIPTTSATVTRAADNASIGATVMGPLLGVNGGSAVLWVSWPTVSSFSSAAGMNLSDGTAANAIRFQRSGPSGNVPQLAVLVGNVEQASPYSTAIVTANSVLAMAASWAANDFRFACNGQQGGSATDTSGSVPAVDRLLFGPATGGAAGGQTIRKVAIYGAPCTNAELIGLTTL